MFDFLKHAGCVLGAVLWLSASAVAAQGADVGLVSQVKGEVSYTAEGGGAGKAREYMRVLMTAYPPIREGFHRGMRCPIVLRCNCKQSRCIGSTAQNVQVPPPLDQMDFPGIRIVAWTEFLENWNVHREGVWAMYDLPPIFALDMTGVMDLVD